MKIITYDVSEYQSLILGDPTLPRRRRRRRLSITHSRSQSAQRIEDHAVQQEEPARQFDESAYLAGRVAIITDPNQVVKGQDIGEYLKQTNIYNKKKSFS